MAMDFGFAPAARPGMTGESQLAVARTSRATSGTIVPGFRGLKGRSSGHRLLLDAKRTCQNRANVVNDPQQTIVVSRAIAAWLAGQELPQRAISIAGREAETLGPVPRSP